MMGKWLLVVCLQVDLLTAQSTETSELCASDGSDGSAYLQSQLKASSALQVAGCANASTMAVTCSNENTINTGVCLSTVNNPQACTGCTGEGLMPSNAAKFRTRSLICENVKTGLIDGTNVCVMTTKKAMMTFKDGNDFMTCKGKQACNGIWRARNVGAVCCSVADWNGHACYGGVEFTLNDGTLEDDEENLLPRGTCTPDACCDGDKTCYGGSDPSYEVVFKNVGSLSCRAVDACLGDFSLERNLYCNWKSLVSFENGKLCTGSKFTFTADGDHCVQCLGNSNTDVCQSANFTFEKSKSKVSIYCVGKDSCRTAKVTFSNGTDSELLLLCKWSNACTNMDLNLNGAKCLCMAQNSGDCPSGCTDSSVTGAAGCTKQGEDTACCAGSAMNNEGHPDCSKCGCGGTTTSTTTTSMGGGGGDPHIDTFDGQHYLLLKQGSFSFWHFSGLDAEVMSAKKWLKKLTVDFKMYAHYSGHLSYTKGVLLLDSSGLQQPKQVLELISEDCLWRAHQPGTAGTWRTIDKPQLLSVPDNDGDDMTAFRFAESPKGQKMNLGLLMKQRDGAWNTVGKLFVRCKPGRHLDMKMAMSSKKEMDCVDGQIASRGHTTAGDERELPNASFLHFMNQRVRTDQEFFTPKSWMDLGGSKEAAEYLGNVDEEGPAFLKGCSEGEMSEASQTCKKYLGQPPVGAGLVSFENSLRNCIFDVCNGGGEVAAELAAEILYAD